MHAEVEPYLAVNPANANNLIGVWQQDRMNNGAARGLGGAVSFDGGGTWARISAPFSRCSGGNAANGGDYQRATDPWVSFAPDGTAYQSALALSGGTFAAGSVNAILVSRSTDGGRTWSNPATLIRDGSGFFNDKEAITADPADARYVYVVWDRLVAGNAGGPTYFARTTDGGASWEAARPIRDPGFGNQTIGNVIVVLPDGTLVNMFNELTGTTTTVATIRIIRSPDKGATWSAPITVATLQALGVSDPETGVPIRDAAILPAIAAGSDGSLAVVWQDARFSGGVHDGIAISRSVDGGLSWSAPLRVNGDPAVPAFIPTVAIGADGTIGVTYFDLRSNTADPNTLPADYWLVTSPDGVNWSEQHVAGPFDYALAPVAGGGAYFLGDYMGLVTVGSTFVPYFGLTTGDAGNRSDIFAALMRPGPALAVGSGDCGQGRDGAAFGYARARAAHRREYPPVTRASDAGLDARQSAAAVILSTAANGPDPFRSGFDATRTCGG